MPSLVALTALPALAAAPQVVLPDSGVNLEMTRTYAVRTVALDGVDFEGTGTLDTGSLSWTWKDVVEGKVRAFSAQVNWGPAGVAELDPTSEGSVLAGLAPLSEEMGVALGAPRIARMEGHRALIVEGTQTYLESGVTFVVWICNEPDRQITQRFVGSQPDRDAAVGFALAHSGCDPATGPEVDAPPRAVLSRPPNWWEAVDDEGPVQEWEHPDGSTMLLSRVLPPGVGRHDACAARAEAAGREHLVARGAKPNRFVIMNDLGGICRVTGPMKGVEPYTRVHVDLLPCPRWSPEPETYVQVIQLTPDGATPIDLRERVTCQ